MGGAARQNRCAGTDGRQSAVASLTATFPLSSTSSLSVTMSDDFLRLVSQANPAARQYQPANGGYPPSSSAFHHNTSDSAQLDPFFDDEDDMPDSAFGRPAAMQSKESGLALTRSAAPPAGMQISSDGDILQDWDDEVQQPPAGPHAFNGSAAFPGGGSPPSQPKSKPPRRPWKWKWPWKREETVLAGERVIALNNPAANGEYCSNYVSTSKYNAVTFFPKFLFGTSPLYFDIRHMRAYVHVFARAILEIRQLVLPLYRLYTTNTRSFSNKSLYYYCSTWCSPTSFGHQRVPGRLGTSCQIEHSYSLIALLETAPIGFRTQRAESEDSSTRRYIRGQEMERHQGGGRCPDGKRRLHPDGHGPTEFQ